ncbi:MAG: DUF362 domain-containing protein [Verrucomicrobia bacterium]|nr:DUF362 domain-containing protein [Verrucomicrobiota bacterium]
MTKPNSSCGQPREGLQSSRLCPKTGGRAGVRSLHALAKWLFTGLGLVSLLWFLVRVIPKPSRAAYPCQRAAAPLASAFVLWLLAVLGSTLAWRKAKELSRRARCWRAGLCFGVAVVAALVAVVNVPEAPLHATLPEPHGPLGEAQGIHPGRVVWVHAPEATDWVGPASSEYWWQTNHTDLAVVEEMVSKAVRAVAGVETDAAALEAIFQHFNEQRGKTKRGYRAGERLAIKINLTTCNARGSAVDPTTYEKKREVMNTIDNSPQMLLALLRQLVYVAGVAPADITVGDPLGMVPKFMWDMLHPEFPDVRFMDGVGKAGRASAEFSKVPIYWSTPAANGKLVDYLPTAFAEADYLINFAVLKGHSSGVTLCAKNHYGSLIRCPDRYYLRDASYKNYYDLHLSLPNAEWSPGLGHYRALVDMMGHHELGGKTLLYLIDGLFAGYYWESRPQKWQTEPFGDGIDADWPSSLFASQDPVAIDSVAYDFLLNEWPRVVTTGGGAANSLQGGAEDYLHEAALADSPPSGSAYDPEKDGTRLKSLGVHEHWNNPFDKKYSRNLGRNEGIELVALKASRPAPKLNLRRSDRHAVVSWPASLYDYRLQRAERLSPPVNWTPVSTAPVFQLGFNTVSNEMTGQSGFFRLAR